MSKEKHYNKVVIVDENDNVTGAENMLVAREKGLLRSGVRIFVVSQSGKILLQKRGKSVLRPNEIDLSAAGGVDEGESRLVAAQRELFEETGIADVKLELIQEPFRSPGTLNSVYKVVVADDVNLCFDESEVAELFWVSPEELNELTDRSDSACTPGLVDTWSQLSDKIKST